MIDTKKFERINKIIDSIEAAKEYINAISKFRDNCDTDSNLIIMEDLEYRFSEDWARIVLNKKDI
jgi:hypothetical protein